MNVLSCICKHYAESLRLYHHTTCKEDTAKAHTLVMLITNVMTTYQNGLRHQCLQVGPAVTVCSKSPVRAGSPSRPPTGVCWNDGREGERAETDYEPLMSDIRHFRHPNSWQSSRRIWASRRRRQRAFVRPSHNFRRWAQRAFSFAAQRILLEAFCIIL
jgi:hypothetical protein